MWLCDTTKDLKVIMVYEKQKKKMEKRNQKYIFLW